MKNISRYFLVFNLLICSIASAQMGEAYELNIHGVKVIVQPSGNEIVEIRTIIKGGVQNYPAAKAGIEALAMTALTECGTVKDDKNTFKNKLDKVSAQMGGYTGMDFATVRMNCIRGDFNVVWPLYTDALLTPRFDPKEFNRIRQDAITGLKASESNPDEAIDKLAKQTAFEGKNYAKDPQGTVETVEKLTVGETKAYYKSIFNRGRIMIVVVGDIEKKDLEQKLKTFIAKIPAGTPYKNAGESHASKMNTVRPEESELATNYIQGITTAPMPGTPDYNAFVLAMRIFSTRHFVEIRSNQGLSYAPSVWFSGGLTPYANIYVTTTDPNKYVISARQLIDKIKNEGFTEEELRNQKTGYLTNVYYQQETNSAQAAALASNEVIHGNWRRANTIKDDIKEVTLEDLNRVFKQYINTITWVYRGDPKKMNPELFTSKDTPKPTDVKTF